jgi:hypothetical protein
MRFHCIISSLFIVLLSACCRDGIHLSPSGSDLVFNDLPVTWDAGIPLGDGMMGSLVWQKGENLRMSLDHIELWDERPMLHSDSLFYYNFKWVQERVALNDYRPVQVRYDEPYSSCPFPCKIPGGAMEFATGQWGKANSVRLYLNNATCEVKWPNGIILHTFVHASKPVGWFRFEQVNQDIVPVLLSPAYQAPPDATVTAGDRPGNDPKAWQLGYPQGKVEQKDNLIQYTQKGADGFEYQIAICYQKKGKTVEGVWSISHNQKEQTPAAATVEEAFKRGFAKDFSEHNDWWANYWQKSSVEIPDTLLMKQYNNEMYKFGSTARSYAPPVSLQAVWTADDGQLPPWKGDYHNDLNTQLTYWPCYTGNHLEEGLGYLNWLWEIIPANKQYTRDYFGVNGLAAPGVCTLKAQPLFGWSQYTIAPFTTAWFAHHFYLHWKYSQDREFLKDRAYPYLREVAVFLDEISVRDADNKRKLPLSSSPELHNNGIEAWFHTTTNFDLGLIRFLYAAAAELAGELDLPEDAARWNALLDEWPDFDLDPQQSLSIAKGHPYNESHRHLSHLIAFHPLGLIDWSKGQRDRDIIRATIQKLEDYGDGVWTGYSYSWLANVKARAMDGEGAARALTVFANDYCLRNTFHVNERKNWRPFTLEGNMAFASGVQEMLLQSHTGVIRVFPAVPASWKNGSFCDLRAMGAWLVSAKMENGVVSQITIRAEKGGTVRVANPGGDYSAGDKKITRADGLLIIDMAAGEVVQLSQI